MTTADSDLRLLFDQLEDEGAVILDGEGRVRSATAAAAIFGGGSAHQLVGGTLFPDQRAGGLGDSRLSEAYARVRHGGAGETVTCRIGEGGRSFELRLLPLPNAVGIVFREVTARVETERALRQSETRLRTLLADLQVGVIIHGGNGEVLDFNQAALELLGMTAAELRGDVPLDPDWSAIHEDGSPFSVETYPVMVALATGRPVRNMVMGVHRRGRRGGAWLLVAADPQVDEAGRVTQVISTFSDITERRAFEARLAVSDRLAAMGTLTAGIGHEINNPLAFITANLTYIGAELEDAATLSDAGRMQEVRAAVQEAREGADRLRRIVAEMRTLARGDARNRPVDLNRVVQSATRPIISELRARARVTTRLSEVPAVHGDEARLGQVLLNLLLNAADAIPKGDPAAHEITVSTFAADAGARAVLEVRDTGQGIAPELRERIFDPFFTAKPVGSGRGLGLAICHHIVSALGGSIAVDSTPGRGSVFRVSLPGATEPAPARA